MRPPLRSSGPRPHGDSMRPSVRPAGHRPHGPSMNPRRPTMNGARPYKSFFQAPSYETRPFLKSSAVKNPYRAPWVPTINRSKDETPEVLINFLMLVQKGLQAQVRVVQIDKGTEFLNQTLHAFFAAEGILYQTSVARTPEQNGAARTMLSAAKVPLFFWAEAISTACFTQNLSLVIPRHEKTPYHIINNRKP
nr:hypothetical protein [Tanacetum cinerariifolium]